MEREIALLFTSLRPLSHTSLRAHIPLHYSGGYNESNEKRGGLGGRRWATGVRAWHVFFCLTSHYEPSLQNLSRAAFDSLSFTSKLFHILMLILLLSAHLLVLRYRRHLCFLCCSPVLITHLPPLPLTQPIWIIGLFIINSQYGHSLSKNNKSPLSLHKKWYFPTVNPSAIANSKCLPFIIIIIWTLNTAQTMTRRQFVISNWFWK